MIDLNIENELHKGVTIIGHYLYTICPWCDKCKVFLRDNEIQYTYIQANRKIFEKIKSQTNSTSVPQVIIDGEFIGGYEDMINYYKEEIT